MIFLLILNLNIDGAKVKLHRDIIKQTKENNFFRKVLDTAKYSQLVLMSIPIGQDIGIETHNLDQILVFVKGKAKAILNGEESEIEENDIIIVPAGTKHNFTNIANEELKLYTIYAPPAHPAQTIDKTKEDAQKREDKY